MTGRTLLRTLGTCCLLPLLFAGPLTSLAQDITLKGTVLNRDASPLRGAQVEFEPGPYVAVSDRNGRFLVPGFRPGRYAITVRAGGKYQVLEVEIPDDTFELRVSW